MKIEHSPLYNNFLSFYFETTVEGEKLYETVLDYHSLTWATYRIATGNKLLSGDINKANDQTEERKE